MAISNLTSQIFANIYFNEFDRYILHDLKPLGYVRYGDDFVSWWPNEAAACQSAVLAEDFLKNCLKLQVNHKVYQLSKANRRLRMLGVEVWPDGRRLDVRMRKRIEKRLSYESWSSHIALAKQHETSRYQDKIRHQMTSQIASK